MPMTRECASKLRSGVYRIFHNNGSQQLAAIGKDDRDRAWFCPVDNRHCGFYYDWGCVDHVVLIASDEPVRTKSCRAAVCFKGGSWKYATINTIPEDADEDEIIKAFMNLFSLNGVDRVFIISTEENKE